ncbi:unnamed protein product [Vicia faba]|uniref:F-box domain-containing protein n=1 Tax=Vicia faba TaxID=3906 RepID=A0AAV1B0I0_VICFA|nr:unnamed protein product [Vicia faba]
MSDCISELPDGVLSYLLTMITMKDLLKTSILSKRWCDLWGLRTNLQFDTINVLGDIEEELVQTGNLINLDNYRDEFAKRVDQFVNKFPGRMIDSLLVNFCLNGEQSSIIDGWIRFAIERGAGRIDLLFEGVLYGYSHLHNCYKFPLDLLLEINTSTLKHLRLERCLIIHPSYYDFTPLKNLRFLSLSDVKVDEILLESLLSNCRLLEELQLYSCQFEASMPKIASSSLLNLKIIGGYILSKNKTRVQVEFTLLDCLKLTSLEYHAYGLDTMTINTPMMKCIDFLVSYEQDLDIFSLSNFPQLDSISIDMSSTVITSLKITQPLKHLKQLNLSLLWDGSISKEADYSLLWILNILQASPLLQKLSIMLTNPKFLRKQKDIGDIERFSHQEVKVIELGGCVGNWFEIEFVINILKYVPKLEQMVLSPCWKEHGTLDWISDPVCFQSARQRISEKLQREQVVAREKIVLV